MHYLYAYIIGMFWKDNKKILRVHISLFAKFDLENGTFIFTFLPNC